MSTFDVHLSLWVVALVLHLVFGVFAFRQKAVAGKSGKLGALLFAGAASVMSLVTLLLVIRVFVVGGSSNVAQFAGESGMNLWSFWFHAWGFLFLGDGLAFVVSTVAVFFPPYPPKHWLSFASRVIAVVAAGYACYVLGQLIPDA